ncbi:MAG: nicotinamide mononucleotide transporter [Ruminococcaceae bacterium]|nr:nicotinamide mononucleotide transporter [Oscillospiraceae bacterium]
MKKLLSYFTKSELAIWIFSMVFIITSFLLFDRANYLTLIASLMGATSLIFCAKGNPIGMIIMVFFCLFYGYISWTFRYYGELMTYVFMSLPMSVFSLVSWLKNPYKGNVSEVAVRKLRRNDIISMILLTILVTTVFYFILDYFDTANLIPSTLSVSTSFFAVFLMYKRSPYYALAYAANDIVLIILWILASISDISYISVVICFITFLVNDIYGFINWRRMQKKQGE